MAARWTARRIVGTLVVVVALGALAGVVAVRAAKKDADTKRNKDEPVTLAFVPGDLARVERVALQRWLSVSGTVVPLRQATVKAKVGGDVRQLAVREGEAVRAGQVVARIDAPDLEARLAERIGALESARAQFALAEKTRAMQTTLLRQNFISQNAYDSSESSFSVARGGVKSAEAQVRIAENALKDAACVAPLAGLVAKRHVQPGEKVAFDAPLVTIVDLSALELQALVPAVDVPELAIGMQAELQVDGFGERRFPARIERINPSTEPGTRALLVYLGIPNPEGALRGGMFATGRIALAARAPVPTLPATAVRSEAGQDFIWVIDDGKLARRIVTVGRRDEASGRVEILTALQPDQPVLAARFDNLKDGAAATIRSATPGPAK